jgi:3-carboxy-cis,cis-muconate cycloisomerase
MLGAMAQDHERATGPWQSEALAVPQSFVLAAGALGHLRTIAEGLTVDADRMRQNLGITNGLVVAEAVMMALAEHIGRQTAHHAVQDACGIALATGRPLAECLAENEEVSRHLDRDALDRLTDPSGYLGVGGLMIDRVLDRAGAKGVRAT